MNGTSSTLPPPPESEVREFALRFTGDRFRLRLGFNKRAQEILGLYFGLEIIVSLTPDGDLLLRRADAVRFGDPEMSGKIAALRTAQRVQGMREVSNWNLLLKSKRRLEMGTAEPVVVVPTPIAADFAWWLRKKMARERRLVPKQLAAAILSAGLLRESRGSSRRNLLRSRAKAKKEITTQTLHRDTLDLQAHKARWSQGFRSQKRWSGSQ